MRVFVTGASGWIGSSLVADLIGAGHQVVGLARSGSSAESLAAAGAEVHHGSLQDVESLRQGAERSEGVVHLAFVHDFSQYQEAIAVDRRAVEAIGEALAGTDRPLVIASGMGGFRQGDLLTEDDGFASGLPRADTALTTLALADRGVRSCVVRLPPTVHGAGDSGFLATLIDVARTKGVSAYIGEGSNRWCGVHRHDAARLFHRALEQAPAGSIVHAVGDEAVPTRAIAETIGRHLGVPARSIGIGEADEHFGFLGLVFGLELGASSLLTQERLGWRPQERGLLEDLDEGHYFAAGASRGIFA